MDIGTELFNVISDKELCAIMKNNGIPYELKYSIRKIIFDLRSDDYRDNYECIESYDEDEDEKEDEKEDEEEEEEKPLHSLDPEELVKNQSVIGQSIDDDTEGA